MTSVLPILTAIAMKQGQKCIQMLLRYSSSTGTCSRKACFLLHEHTAHDSLVWNKAGCCVGVMDCTFVQIAGVKVYGIDLFDTPASTGVCCSVCQPY